LIPWQGFRCGVTPLNSDRFVAPCDFFFLNVVDFKGIRAG
jgi:hypothetical protein